MSDKQVIKFALLTRLGFDSRTLCDNREWQKRDFEGERARDSLGDAE